MPRLGLTLAIDRLDAPLSDHFGKAPWLAVLEPGAPPRFLANAGQSGRAVAEAFAAAGVTDVVAGHLGPGAFGHLLQAGLRVWQAAAGEPAAEQARRFEAGALQPLAAPPPHQHGGGGCGCGGH
ncbi:MAG TPA: NifB/NifX family molybdenum-iron cluster-binding protein [Anaeromyxobacteraceae bacterium]|nr:NifB/NifX family molybdenum-iron cluster-binding protein [Anaeromyxobacteraceae bacterium]